MTRHRAKRLTIFDHEKDDCDDQEDGSDFEAWLAHFGGIVLYSRGVRIGNSALIQASDYRRELSADFGRTPQEGPE